MKIFNLTRHLAISWRENRKWFIEAYLFCLHMEYSELGAPVRYSRPVESPIRGPQSGIPEGKDFTGPR